MVYFTGDIHGSPWKIKKFCSKMKLTENDVVVILGDVGANFYNDERDNAVKRTLSKLKPTILCVHGNHEMRPWNVAGYRQKQWNEGTIWYQEEFPNLLFASDGEIYLLNGLRYLVIGGAYSIDKYYRLQRGYGWWEDEQPSDEIKCYVESQVATQRFDVVLSHTCPVQYEPTEMFLPMIDQSLVDKSTEEWLGTIEKRIDYKAWYCGHYHTDKRIDRMHFLFNSFESDDWLHQDGGNVYEAEVAGD